MSTYIMQYRLEHDGPLYPFTTIRAVSSVAAICRAAARLDDVGIDAVEIIATLYEEK